MIHVSLTFYLYKLGRCGNNGSAVARDVTKNNRNSTKCGCKAKFKLHVCNGKIVFTSRHDALCKQLFVSDLNNNAHYYKCSQSPQVKEASLALASKLMHND